MTHMQLRTQRQLLDNIDALLASRRSRSPMPSGRLWGPDCTQTVPLAQPKPPKRQHARELVDQFRRHLHLHQHHNNTITISPISNILDEDEEPGWVVRKRQNLATSPLCRLPLELLLMVKAYLSPTSVFILCHTSAFFFPLLDKGVLEKKPLVYFGIGDVRKLLQGEYFCRRCFDRLEGAFRRLRVPLYCDGCGLEHPAFLFPLDQRADGEGPKRPRMCFGRIGHIQLCAHKTVSWSDVEKVRDRSGNPTSIACTNRSHLPLRSQWWAGMLPTNLRPRSAFESRGNLPTVKIRLSASFSPTYPNLMRITLSSRVPLFDLANPHHHFTSRELEASWQRAVAGPLFGYRLCPHVHDNDKTPLRAFASDTCACVPAPATNPHDDDDNPSHCCLCREFTCPVCRGVYTWRRDGGRVYLSFKWSRLVSGRPTSRNWLRALAPESFGLGPGSLDEDLWCEHEFCHTNKRWEALLEEMRGLF